MNNKILNIYAESQITKKIRLSGEEIGEDLMSVLQNKINNLYTGKCSSDGGIIKKNSIKIIQISAPVLDSEGFANITVVFKCLICNPPINAIISCKITSITRAGINAKIANETQSPIIVFVCREYKNDGNDFSNFEKDQIINVKIIGKKYQLNDEYINIIGELVNT